MKSNTKKRLIAFMLCMVLVLSSAISAFADEGTVHRVPTDTVELSSEIMKDGVSQGTLFATIPGEAFQSTEENATLQMNWSYVKKKYKLNTTNFLFLCNC